MSAKAPQLLTPGTGRGGIGTHIFYIILLHFRYVFAFFMYLHCMPLFRAFAYKIQTVSFSEKYTIESNLIKNEARFQPRPAPSIKRCPRARMPVLQRVGYTKVRVRDTKRGEVDGTLVNENIGYAYAEQTRSTDGAFALALAVRFTTLRMQRQIFRQHPTQRALTSPDRLELME